MKKPSYYIINGITLYRLIMSPVLVVLLFTQYSGLFRWLLALGFLTDLIDGWLARRYKVATTGGASLDSVADDFNVIAGIIGAMVLKPAFVQEKIEFIIILFVLFLLQMALALLRYGQTSSFHTYTAKCAAIMQGVFLILLFFLPEPVGVIFYLAFLITLIDLIEEIILVIMLPEWEVNVKGLYWLIKRKRMPRCSG